MPVSAVLAGRYQLRGVLGRGGMADVHDGWDLRLERPVAVKVLRPELASVPDTRRRFEAEARLAATLNHPNVVAVHDCGEDAGVAYIVMERLPGHTLADEIAGGPLPDGRVRSILADVLAAVGAAHHAGILHRDIKPGNVLFTATGAVKVTDFGIAKSADSDHTATGQVLGTVAYLSPDRITGKPATPSDDLYAVGVVGYEAVTGQRPFAGDNILSLARAIIDGAARPLHEMRPDADPGLVHTIERAMARDPRERYVDAHAMRDAVLGASGAVPPPTRAFTATTSVHELPPEPVRPRRRTGLIIAAIAALLVAVVVGALAIAAQNRDGTVGPGPGTTTVSPPPAPVSAPSSAVEINPVAPVPPPNAPSTNAPKPRPGNGNGNNGNGNNKTKDNEKEKHGN
ncbi:MULTISPECIES: serine/threonine-protein kinase [unclassified Rhodococcus (in: high G+C Gram-positive bacteria)]|uniref:serine/threonine-protein kinase n=1 Tax=unclassified Rhodococcus (in: high G+C Gram-positive bacteria) TaxID=192944 RepID=UPI00163A52C4|nr:MULTISPECIES: serine/threonine-protein kinase [unclassified Rhodococcus (in: high G+C Gram-positive bacteria)]MBC2639103.1 serine/threonine protein kinase [Rhodococcus sp. 3A]MBC2896155.1 serine/threonine protein kinase [Rhodococcus sp. 4CII]